MGALFGKQKKSRVTEQDKAVLVGIKLSRELVKMEEKSLSKLHYFVLFHLP